MAFEFGKAIKREISYTRAGLGTAFGEAMSNLYRRWFVQGQADYRAGNSRPDGLNESATEAWLMGWQCDAAVEARGLRLSDLGLFMAPPDAMETVDASVPDVQGKGVDALDAPYAGEDTEDMSEV